MDSPGEQQLELFVSLVHQFANPLNALQTETQLWRPKINDEASAGL